MKKKIYLSILTICVIFAYLVFRNHNAQDEGVPSGSQPLLRSIHGKVVKGETVFDIFKKHGLNMEQLSAMREAALQVHRLRDISSGQPYSITIDNNNRVDSFVYWIDDDSFLRIEGDNGGFQAERCRNPYELKTRTITGTIKDNLFSAIGSSREEVLLALKISDIFAWDIDFTSDLRQGDKFTIIVEGLYLDGFFKKYGEVLSVEFVNGGKRHLAYRFLSDGKIDYYDEEGNSLRKAFLKAPLSFRRISSAFSKRRLHPVLKRYRPHRGVDYTAARGTPVSATGDGTVLFSGRKGAYGKLVILRHRNKYSTYYGHLSRIKGNIHAGVHVNQGDVIGYVGATGLATGPHLHYEMRCAGKHINPLTVRQAGKHVPASRMAQFKELTTAMNRMRETPVDDTEPLSATERKHTLSDKEG